MVETFYGRVQQDPVLSPIFARHIEDWTPHLLRMKAFWRSVLLRTGEFQRNHRGAPPVLHAGIEGLSAQHFTHWLALFSEVLDEVVTPDVAQTWLTKARGIGDSLWRYAQHSRSIPA